MYRIFIIEDDEKISGALKRSMEKYGFEASCASRFREIVPELEAFSPHLVLLDINLPYFDGYYWCRQIRARSSMPIIFISAREGEMDQVMAIEHGGDDYITKPIHLDLLIAKVKGVLRRVYGEYASVSGLNIPGDVLNVQSMRLNLSRNEMRWQEKKVELTKNECLLAKCFMQQPGQIVSRDQLLEALWDDVQFVDNNTLTVNVTRLRKKLEEIGLSETIETVRGQGYKLILNNDRDESN